MKKNNKKVNSLIKRNGLIKSLRNFGINRLSRKGEESLNRLISEELIKMFAELKDHMSILGKRVLDNEVVCSYEKNKNSKEEIDYK